MSINGRVVLTMLLCLTAGIVSAESYAVKKNVDGYSVAMKIDRNPPIAGHNNVTIEVIDAITHCACDANVVIEYSRPAMPGTPALRYIAETELQKGRHVGKISPSVSGFWNIAVNLTTGDKTWTTHFVVQVE